MILQLAADSSQRLIDCRCSESELKRGSAKLFLVVKVGRRLRIKRPFLSLRKSSRTLLATLNANRESLVTFLFSSIELRTKLIR